MLYTEIPSQRPNTPLLDRIDHPQQLRLLERSQLEQVADELRQFILYAAGQSGGHFGANLGVIELTVALHYCFNTPHDRLIWDVGHQAYPHKALTGRREQLVTIRDSGETNMFDIATVQRLAFERDFYELVLFIEEHRKEYIRFILTGHEE